MRTIAGLRGDYFTARGRQRHTRPIPATRTTAIASPKGGLIFGPFAQDRVVPQRRHRISLQRRARRDHHRRSRRQRDAAAAGAAAGALEGRRGRRRAPRRSTGSKARSPLFVLDFASEILFVGDAGTTEPSRPSRRVGVEWTNHYKVNSWLASRSSISPRRARASRDFDPVGNHIPGAPGVIASAGVVLGGKTGWFGAAKLRYFGPRPLIEDDSVRSGATTLVNAPRRLQIRERRCASSSTRSTCSTPKPTRSTTSTLAVARRPADARRRPPFHPVEPLAVRLTLAGQF